MNNETNREKVLAIIGQALSDANSYGDNFDAAEEAMLLLEKVEGLCVARVHGELIFADPDDNAAFIEGGPFA